MGRVLLAGSIASSVRPRRAALLTIQHLQEIVMSKPDIF